MAYTSANDYLKVLDEILKKNKGTRVNTLYDTNANIPDQLATANPLPALDKPLTLDAPEFIDQMQFSVPQQRTTRVATTAMPEGDVLGASTENFRSPYINYDAQGNVVTIPGMPSNFQFQQPEVVPAPTKLDEYGNVVPDTSDPSYSLGDGALTPGQRKQYDSFLQRFNSGTFLSPQEQEFITANDPSGEKFKKYILDQIRSTDVYDTEPASIKYGQSALDYMKQQLAALKRGDTEAASLFGKLAAEFDGYAKKSEAEAASRTEQFSSQNPGYQDFVDRGTTPPATQKTNVFSSAIDKANPTGSIDFGISEYLNGQPQLAQEKQKQTGQNLGNMVAGIGQTLGIPEIGASEYVSGLFGNEPKNQQISNVFANALSQAGQGVSGLSTALGDTLGNIFRKKDIASMGSKNVVGEDTGGAIASNLGDIKSSSGGNASNNQDAFFKGGGFDIYRDQLNPEVTKGYRGALDPNLFKSTFFENPDNVANVFGNTAMGKDATGKYKSYMSTQYPIKPGGESPTITKSEKYLSSYDGLYDGDQYWRDAFSARGEDVNSGSGKVYQERERQNMKDWTWEEANPIYYENQYNKSVLDSIPEVLQSDFSFKAPRSSGGAMMSTPPQGLYQPVKGDATAKEDYSKARSIPQIPSSNVFTPKGQMQSVPSVLGASVSRAPTPKPTPPIMSKPAPPQANASYGGQPVYNPPPAPSRPSAPSSSPAPNASRGGQPVYNPPQAPSRPAPQAPAPRPAPTPAPSPAPAPRPSAPMSTPAPRPSAPSSKQAPSQNVFQKLVSYLFGR